VETDDVASDANSDCYHCGLRGISISRGMWGNFIRFVNVLFAAVLATNFFEPLARILEELISPKLTYFYDFLAFWLVYAVSFLVLHVATAAASRVKVRLTITLTWVAEFSSLWLLA